MGAISTGLGEIYMWTVEFEPGREREGRRFGTASQGWQRDGSYLTPEGESLRTDVERAAYLRTVQDWLIRPQLRGVEGVAGVDAIGGYVKQYHVEPDPMQLVSYGLTFADVSKRSRATTSAQARDTWSTTARAISSAPAGRIESRDEIADHRRRVAQRNAHLRAGRCPRHVGRELAHG
jgi:cobalt-zinc-cadmium resistance protein CzcA